MQTSTDRRDRRRVERSVSDLHLLFRRRRRKGSLVWSSQHPLGQLDRVDEQGSMLATTCDSALPCADESVHNTKASTTTTITSTTSVGKTALQRNRPSRPAKRHTLAAMNGLDEVKMRSGSDSSGGKWYSSLLQKKRKALNLFGSVRRGSAREKGREARRSSYVEPTRDTSPRSPVTSGRRSRSGSDPHSHFMSVRPSALQASTGFTPRDELSTSLTVPSGAPHPAVPQYGSWTNLRTDGYQENRAVLPYDENMLKQAKKSLRKSNSLPRSVLCSPVMSRSSRRPYSQWVTDTADNISISTNSSTRSAATPLNCSREDLLSPSNSPPRSTVTGEEDTSCNGGAPYHSASLTRSSSLPIDGDTLDQIPTTSRDSECNELGKDELRLLTTGGIRLSLRSQSFNNHMRNISVKHAHDKDTSGMRQHVARFLIETEQSYLNSLQTVTECYSDTLSAPGAVDSAAVSLVLQQVPIMISVHRQFMKEMQERLKHWSGNQCLGDVFLSTFTQKVLVDAYSKFIQNFLRAKAAITLAKHTTPALAKALEQQQARVDHGRLSFNDLIIKPVQRIPRYMLFLKDLLKHTAHAHPDHTHLEEALEELTALAERVNEAERQSSLFNLQQELLIMVDGLAESLTPNSMLVRQDTVTEIVRGTRKERMLMLFSDVVVCTSTRKRSGGFKRNSLMNINSIQPEHSQHRVKWSCTLTSVTATQSQVSLFERRRQNTLEKAVDKLQRDEDTLLQMMALSSSITSQHHDVTVSLQELLAVVRGNLVSRKRELDNLAQDSARIDLNYQNGLVPARYTLVFPTQKNRQVWEQDLCSCQQILIPHSYHAQQVSPHQDTEHTSLQPVAEIAGVPHDVRHVNLPGLRGNCQLSAVAVSPDGLQLYVCSSGSTGGRVTILRATSLGSTPRLVANVPITHSRILCATCISVTSPPTPPSLPLPMAAELSDHRATGNGNSLLSLDSTHHADDEEEDEEDDIREKLFLFSTDETTHDTPECLPDLLRSDSAPPNLAGTPYHHPPRIILRLPTSPMIESPEATPTGCSSQLWLWLGTEAGQVNMMRVTPSGNLQMTNMITTELSASVLFISGHQNRVFTGLADGRMAVFNLNSSSSGEFRTPELVMVIDSSPIVASALLHDNQLLVASKSSIMTCSPSLTCSELVALPSHVRVGAMVAVDGFVLVAVEDSLTVRAYSSNESGDHAHTGSINCTESVMSALTADNVDPQMCSHAHIVSMTTYNKLVVLGTSVGVIVVLPLPQPTAATPLMPVVLSTRHIGPVHTLVSLTTGDRAMLISGGKGVEGGSRHNGDNCCLLMWS